MISARTFVRLIAYGIGLIVTWSWLGAAQDSLDSSLFDLATVSGGAALTRAAIVLGLDPATTLFVAKIVACAKLGIGLFLLIALMHTAAAWLRLGEGEDEVLDIALLLAAIGAGLAVLKTLATETGELMPAIEFFLCIVAREMLVLPARMERREAAI